MGKKRSAGSKDRSSKKPAAKLPLPDQTVELHIPPRLYDILYDANDNPILPPRFIQQMIESLFGDRELYGINHVDLVKKGQHSASKASPSALRKVCDGS